MRGVLIRPYRGEDASALALVFHRAVRRGAARHYSLPQRLAWSPRPAAPETWHARLERLDTMVAETAVGPVGFMAFDRAAGFLDYAYVAPDMVGQGVGSTLLAVIEGRARCAGLARLETEASRVAQPFFAARDWRIVERQCVKRHGIRLPNAVMEKHLVQAEKAA